MRPSVAGAPASGRDQFDVAWRLALLAWFGCVLMQLILYIRPGPYGGPFLLEWQRYFGLSVYFDLLGTWLISLPFLLVWLASWKREVARRFLVLQQIHLLLLTANLVISAFDHEVLRFLGTRLSLSFILIYGRPTTLSDPLFQDVLLGDQGGAFFVPLLLIGVPAVYYLAGRAMIRRGLFARPLKRPPFWLAMAITILPLAAPANGWAQATSQFRVRRTEPVILALFTDFSLGFEDVETPPDMARLAAAYQRRWQAESADPGWRFTDPQRPYVRRPLGDGSIEPRPWNVIYIQLETYRGLDMGFLTRRRPSPTPFLDTLAAAPDAALWTRALSFGMPTINGLFATHCSIAPHSSRFITSFTTSQLYCLPEALRKRGYRTEMFNAGDTDWDNSSLWLSGWYDRLWRFPRAEQLDRPVFQAAASRIRALGRSGRPFMASVVSVTNHTPFRSREAAFERWGTTTPSQRILNTIAYTDDVVREFVEALRSEPWFDRTIVVIVGDHGFNLGEHRTPPGQISLYREAVWVPIIMSGPHPRLIPGRRDQPATLLDVAPTLSDLLGIREPVPWQGHSLLGGRRSYAFAFRVQGWRLAEEDDWSMVQSPTEERASLFDRKKDWLQHDDRAGQEGEIADALLARSEEARRLNDYLLRNDLVWPRG